MTTITKTRDFKRDGAGNPIAGGSVINAVANPLITDAVWTAIRMPATETCKQLIVKERGDGTWKLSAVANGATYFTVTAALSMEIAKSAGQLLFYARMSSGSGTLEIIFGD